MSRTRRARWGTVTSPKVSAKARADYIDHLAVELGQSPAFIADQLSRAVELGWLVETRDGWRAALPAEVAGPDWTGVVT